MGPDAMILEYLQYVLALFEVRALNIVDLNEYNI